MYANENTWVYLNDGFKQVKDVGASLFSQTLHYGNGVFEGIRAYDTEEGAFVFKAKEHYERLLYSAQKMGIQINYSVEELIALTYELLEKNELNDAYIRPLVYLDDNMGLFTPKESVLFLSAWRWGKLLGDQLTRLCISSYRRPDPKSVHVDAKVCGHYVNSILACNEAKSKGFDDALLLDANGNVAEASGANFFYEKDEVLYTPPKGNILPGITRSTILYLAKDLDYKVVEKYFTPEDVFGADGAFITGTAAEVTGLYAIDDHEFKRPFDETIGAELSRRYQLLVRNKSVELDFFV